jgi:TPR repeat protein
MIRIVCLMTLGWVAVATAAPADLYSADAAYGKKEFDVAFRQYQELAGLGHRFSQESLAVMYVNGEGVERDNVLGYAWAKIAKEQGGSEVVDGIIRQLEPHLNEAARKRVEELRGKFGQEALKARLLPVWPRPPEQNPKACAEMTRIANPDDFHPRGDLTDGGGKALMEFTVQPDGRAHSARVVTASTPYLFDEAARAVLMNSAYRLNREDGVRVPCTLMISVSFRPWNGATMKSELLDVKLPATKAKAEAGDPRAQYLYAQVLLSFSEVNTADDPIFPWLLKAAQGGMAGAQYAVGAVTLAGTMVEREPDKAVIWLEKSATAGHPQAQVLLANYLVTSRTDEASRAHASSLLEAAVKSNYHAAKYPLAALLAAAPEVSKRDPRRALQLIEDVMPLVKRDPVPHEVRAAALAWIGDFDEAVKHQKTALSRARRLGWDVSQLEARLAAYQAKKTWTGNLIAW